MGLPGPSSDETEESGGAFVRSSVAANPQYVRAETIQSARDTSGAASNLVTLQHGRGLPDAVWEYSLSGLAGSKATGRAGLGEKSLYRSLKTAPNLGAPTSIIVGFDAQSSASSHPLKPTITVDRAEASQVLPYELGSISLSRDSGNNDCAGIVVRKKTSSPLTDMLASGQNEGLLGYESADDREGKETEEQATSGAGGYAYKAGNSGGYMSSPVPIPRLFERDHPTRGRGSTLELQTDGPVLSRRVVPSTGDAICMGVGSCVDNQPDPAFGLKRTSSGGQTGRGLPEKGRWQGTSKEKFSKGFRSPHPGLSPVLSLSPLGPRWPSPAPAGGDTGSMPVKIRLWECSDANRVVSPTHLRPVIWGSELLHTGERASEEDAVPSISENLFEETGIISHNVVPGAPHKQLGVASWGFEPMSAPTGGLRGPGASFIGLPTRRSLVGSFEESLLSGRFLAGKSCQRLDGFLALLSVTGGSWSPPLRRLPFAVTCVDGDSSLLYYASIDVAGSTSRGKSFSKARNSQNNDSRASKSRFRIPIRGRVQTGSKQSRDDTCAYIHL